MPVIAHALFYAAYAMVSFALGLALIRVGDADAASATLGGLCLFTAFAITHAGLSAASAAGAVHASEKRLKKEFTAELERVTAVQRRITEETGALGDQVARLDHAMSERPRLEAPSAMSAGVGGEAALIDQLAAKLGAVMDQRLEQVRRVTGPEPTPYVRVTRSPIDIVRDALKENRVELHLQPIVSAAAARTAFYEGFTRLKDASGRLILPQEFMPAAEQAGLMATIDNMLLFRCVQIVRKLTKQDRRIGIFCNLSPRALADEHFFPQFLDFMRENGDLAGALIFEIPQAAYEGRTAMEARAMAKLVDLGFRFSIDKVTKLDVDLLDLERSGVRFVKASAAC